MIGFLAGVGFGMGIAAFVIFDVRGNLRRWWRR